MQIKSYMKEEFCEGCGKKINTIPFIGDSYHKFEKGVYCQKCAEIIIKKRRSKL